MPFAFALRSVPFEGLTQQDQNW